ncbi:hypothetical protein IE53DRAFT_386292 [Violaceomyces palustris]|uniref:Uncharacterized protein n=1 Tax=Violaceomyces palustris TaxID=1673888 RepID=A0ACD0P072_9BASI|nr:hypothetical protein IE53DRAFT_386292 [Violaceomyces palustris]
MPIAYKNSDAEGTGPKPRGGLDQSPNDFQLQPVPKSRKKKVSRDSNQGKASVDRSRAAGRTRFKEHFSWEKLPTTSELSKGRFIEEVKLREAAWREVWNDKLSGGGIGPPQSQKGSKKDGNDLPPFGQLSDDDDETCFEEDQTLNGLPFLLAKPSQDTSATSRNHGSVNSQSIRESLKSPVSEVIQEVEAPLTKEDVSLRRVNEVCSTIDVNYRLSSTAGSVASKRRMERSFSSKSDFNTVSVHSPSWESPSSASSPISPNITSTRKRGKKGRSGRESPLSSSPKSPNSVNTIPYSITQNPKHTVLSFPPMSPLSPGRASVLHTPNFESFKPKLIVVTSSSSSQPKKNITYKDTPLSATLKEIGASRTSFIQEEELEASRVCKGEGGGEGETAAKRSGWNVPFWAKRFEANHHRRNPANPIRDPHHLCKDLKTGLPKLTRSGCLPDSPNGSLLEGGEWVETLIDGGSGDNRDRSFMRFDHGSKHGEVDNRCTKRVIDSSIRALPKRGEERAGEKSGCLTDRVSSLVEALLWKDGSKEARSVDNGWNKVPGKKALILAGKYPWSERRGANFDGDRPHGSKSVKPDGWGGFRVRSSWFTDFPKGPLIPPPTPSARLGTEGSQTFGMDLRTFALPRKPEALRVRMRDPSFTPGLVHEEHQTHQVMGSRRSHEDTSGSSDSEGWEDVLDEDGEEGEGEGRERNGTTLAKIKARDTIPAKDKVGPESQREEIKRTPDGCFSSLPRAHSSDYGSKSLRNRLNDLVPSLRNMAGCERLDRSKQASSDEVYIIGSGDGVWGRPCPGQEMQIDHDAVSGGLRKVVASKEDSVESWPLGDGAGGERRRRGNLLLNKLKGGKKMPLVLVRSLVAITLLFLVINSIWLDVKLGSQARNGKGNEQDVGARAGGGLADSQPWTQTNTTDVAEPSSSSTTLDSTASSSRSPTTTTTSSNSDPPTLSTTSITNTDTNPAVGTASLASTSSDTYPPGVTPLPDHEEGRSAASDHGQGADQGNVDKAVSQSFDGTLSESRRRKRKRMVGHWGKPRRGGDYWAAARKVVR